MKKFISTILALSIMMTMCIPAFADKTKLGDVNADGNITAVDARIILQVVAGSKEETDFIKSIGDMNDDGKVSAVDARVVLQVVAGIIPAPERPDDGVLISANKTQLSIKDSPEIVYFTMTGGETLTYYIDDEEVVYCEWGDWDGDTIPLTFYPVSDGHTTVDVYIDGYDESIEVEVTVNMSETDFRADEKLKNYVMSNGYLIENGVYGVMEIVQGRKTTIYYDLNEEEFIFACNIVLDDGETTAFMDYKYGESTQFVMTITTLYSYAYECATGGYINTATYSLDNIDVRVVYNEGWSDKDAESIAEHSNAILLAHIEQMLYYTGTGITLYDLGFISW